jgi:amino acid transporter
VTVERPSLVRAIGRWSLTAAVVNSVIGSGIFGLPSAVAGLVGAWSPLAVLLAGCGILIVVVCFAEVGSRFEDAGGPYLYTREAFGPLVGFHIGWLHIWTRLLSGAAVLNVLAAYLVPLVPGTETPAGRAAAMVTAMALVTVVNLRGVRIASWATNAFTVAKLLPLLLLVLVGVFQIREDVFATQAVSSPDWPEAVLLLVFAYGGFESAVIAASETRDPKRDTAFALIAAMSAVTVVYCLVQLTVVGVLPHAAEHATPVAATLGVLLGGAGATLGSLAVVVSVYGWLTGFTLMTPRILMSMAERGEVPALLGHIHARFRTPHVAIVINAAVVLAMGLYGSFVQTATLAATARLGIFALTCGSLIALRRLRGPSPTFQVPAGPTVALTGIALSMGLLGTRDLRQVWILAAIVTTGALVLALRRKKG